MWWNIFWLHDYAYIHRLAPQPPSPFFPRPSNQLLRKKGKNKKNHTKKITLLPYIGISRRSLFNIYWLHSSWWWLYSRQMKVLHGHKIVLEITFAILFMRCVCGQKKKMAIYGNKHGHVHSFVSRAALSPFNNNSIFAYCSPLPHPPPPKFPPPLSVSPLSMRLKSTSVWHFLASSSSSVASLVPLEMLI